MGRNVYLIELAVDTEFDDNKRQVIDGPLVIGRFPDVASAHAFAEEVALGEGMWSQGGYSAYHVIGDGSEGSPEQYKDEWAENIEMRLEDRAQREAQYRDERRAEPEDIRCEAVHSRPNGTDRRQCLLVAGHRCSHHVENVWWSNAGSAGKAAADAACLKPLHCKCTICEDAPRES